MAVTDNFTDTDGVSLPTHNANWSAFNPSSYNNAIILSNAASSIGLAGNRYGGRAWTDDQYAQATVVLPGDKDWYVAVRMISSDTKTLYVGGSSLNDLGDQRYCIQSFVGGVQTLLAHHASQLMLANDIVKLSVVSTLLTLTVNSIDILSVSDGAIASGQTGFVIQNSVQLPMLDDWQGDDLGVPLTVAQFTPAVQSGMRHAFIGRRYA